MVHVNHTFKFTNLKPFSVNSAYIRTFSGVAKSAGANEFCAQVFNVLSCLEEQVKILELKRLFDPDKHGYAFKMCAYYPKEQFYTKKGQISNRTIDCTNWEKILVDCFCLPKFCNIAWPHGCNNLEIDDRYVVDVDSRKRPSNGMVIEVQISVVDKPEFTYLEL